MIKMVNQTIHATYTETYDVNTLLNELSLLAIHTPQAPALKRMFHGFFEQYKKVKILGCNFKMVCATKQDLDPTLAGSGVGQIDPRNVLNPILFKACTGEHIDALCDQIYNQGQEIAPTNALVSGSISQHVDIKASAVDAYYSLLADDSWRKEHPQRGITVMGLRPMVHKVVTTQPFKWSVGRRSSSIDGSFDAPLMTGAVSPSSGSTAGGFGAQSGARAVDADPVNPSVFVSNGLTEMPWLDTSYTKVSTFTDGSGQESVNRKVSLLAANIPRVYMGCLVLPPSIGENSANLYYRIQVNWHILFKDFRPVQDLLALETSAPILIESDDIYQLGLADNDRTYFNMYHTAAKLQKDYGSFDTAGVESVDKILEKGM